MDHSEAAFRRQDLCLLGESAGATVTFADLGMPACVPLPTGRLYDSGLLRIGDEGDVQCSVESALASITETRPAATTSPRSPS